MPLLLTKRVSDDNENKSTPASISPSKPPAKGRKDSASMHGDPMNLTTTATPPTSQAAASYADEKHDGPRQRSRRNIFHPSAGTWDRSAIHDVVTWQSVLMFYKGLGVSYIKVTTYNISTDDNKCSPIPNIYMPFVTPKYSAEVIRVNTRA